VFRVKAVVLREPGGLDQLQFAELPSPQPGPGEVIVRLRAAAVNRVDVWVRQGTLGFPECFPHVCGSDGAGVIAKGPRGVSKGERETPGELSRSPASPVPPSYTDGDAPSRVVINPWITCGFCESCVAGDTNLCPELRIVGAHTWGTYAEEACVPARNVLPIPEGLTYEEAAAIPMSFGVAWNALVERARLRAGETCLVLAAGSGVGSAAVQIARLVGARVIAAASSPRKLRRARELGAEETINYIEEEIAEAATRLTGGRGVDVVLDHIGPATFSQSLRALARGGRLVTCGATTGAVAAFDLKGLYDRQVAILGATGAARRDLLRVLRLVGERKLRPVIDSVCDLKDAARAQERLLARDSFGKLVLQIT
jgi:NADPH:quinone reductase-like Zn-dependent oxidoreductase